MVHALCSELDQMGAMVVVAVIDADRDGRSLSRGACSHSKVDHLSGCRAGSQDSRGLLCSVWISDSGRIKL